MIIQIHIRDKWINILKNGMINFIRKVYGWISRDDEFLGHVLASSHFIIAATIYILILACHIIYPSIYFQLFVFVCITAIWLQHVFLKVCISFIAERELTKFYVPSIPLFEVVLKYIGLTFDDFTNYFISAETICVSMFALEILSKLSVYFYKKYGIIY